VFGCMGVCEGVGEGVCVGVSVGEGVCGGVCRGKTWFGAPVWKLRRSTSYHQQTAR
jgi:hypothetical protein